MRVSSMVLALAASMAIVGNLMAAEDEKKAPQERRPDRAMREPWELPKAIELSDQQKAKLEAVKSEFGARFKAARQKMGDVVTEGQRKARDEAAEAVRKAQAALAEAREKAREAFQLSDEQKAKMEEVRKELGELRKEVREKIGEILTPEQKEQLRKLWRPERGQRGDHPRPTHKPEDK